MADGLHHFLISRHQNITNCHHRGSRTSSFSSLGFWLGVISNTFLCRSHFHQHHFCSKHSVEEDINHQLLVKGRGCKLAHIRRVMSEVGSERSKSWNIYTTPDQSPSSQTGIGQEASWKNFGSSMNAISFGFVATAILISMFLIMAIFEHLFRPTSPFSSSDEVTNNSAESGPAEKFSSQNMVATSHASDFSVLMPGQHIPTFIAQPAPLPCQREGTYWPSHDHNFSGP